MPKSDVAARGLKQYRLAEKASKDPLVESDLARRNICDTPAQHALRHLFYCVHRGAAQAVRVCNQWLQVGFRQFLSICHAAASVAFGQVDEQGKVARIGEQRASGRVE